MERLKDISLQDLKKELVNKGASLEEVESATRKTQLEHLIYLLEDNNNAFDNVIMEEDEKINMINDDEETVEEIPIPKYTDPGWSDYVLSQFDVTEVDQEGHPLRDGLRRVTELLLGEIIVSRPEIQFVNYPIKDKRGTEEMVSSCLCTYEIKIAWKKDSEILFGEDGSTNGVPIRTFSSCAESHHKNTDVFFRDFTATIAEARAESRTYRKALQLKVVTKDELCEGKTMNQGTEITNNQTLFLTTKCNQLGLDKEKLADYHFAKLFNKLSKDEGKELFKRVSEYQRDVKSIPEEIKLCKS